MASTTKPVIPPVALDTITQHIGNTPLVRLNRLPRSLGIDATVYAKLEYFNAGGSVKDRIALRMIEEAEKSGRIKPGDTLIEPTSGNTLVFFSPNGSQNHLKIPNSVVIKGSMKLIMLDMGTVVSASLWSVLSRATRPSSLSPRKCPQRRSLFYAL